MYDRILKRMQEKNTNSPVCNDIACRRRNGRWWIIDFWYLTLYFNG